MSNRSLARKNRQRFRSIRSTIKTFVLNLNLSHPNGNSRVYGEIPHPQCVGYGVSDKGVVTDIRKEFVFPTREDMDQAWQTGIMTLGTIDHENLYPQVCGDTSAEPEELDIAAGLDAALGRRDVTTTPMWCDKNGGIIAWKINK